MYLRLINNNVFQYCIIFKLEDYIQFTRLNTVFAAFKAASTLFYRIENIFIYEILPELYRLFIRV